MLAWDKSFQKVGYFRLPGISNADPNMYLLNPPSKFPGSTYVKYVCLTPKMILTENFNVLKFTLQNYNILSSYT